MTRKGQYGTPNVPMEKLIMWAIALLVLFVIIYLIWNYVGSGGGIFGEGNPFG